jgi:hypothetical protein
MTSFRVNSFHWRVSLALLVAFSALVANLSATPVNFDEASGGDLPVHDVLPIFALEIGTNTVGGTIGRQIPFFDDFDSFAFTIPAGARLKSGIVELKDAANDLDLVDWELYDGAITPVGVLRREYFRVYSPGSTSIQSRLGPGTYNIYSVGWTIYDPAPALSNYTFTLEVAVIPEPTIGLLITSGIAAISMCRWRCVAIRN